AAELVGIPDDVVERFDHRAAVAPTLMLRPRRDGLEVADTQGPALEPERAPGDGTVRGHRAVDEPEHVHPPERVLPVLLGEPAVPGSGEHRAHRREVVRGELVARDEALLDQRARAGGSDRSAFG